MTFKALYSESKKSCKGLSRMQRKEFFQHKRKDLQEERNKIYKMIHTIFVNSFVDHKQNIQMIHTLKDKRYTYHFLDGYNGFMYWLRKRKNFNALSVSKKKQKINSIIKKTFPQYKKDLTYFLTTFSDSFDDFLMNIKCILGESCIHVYADAISLYISVPESILNSYNFGSSDGLKILDSDLGNIIFIMNTKSSIPTLEHEKRHAMYSLIKQHISLPSFSRRNTLWSIVYKKVILPIKNIGKGNILKTGSFEDILQEYSGVINLEFRYALQNATNEIIAHHANNTIFETKVNLKKTGQKTSYDYTLEFREYMLKNIKNPIARQKMEFFLNEFCMKRYHQIIDTISKTVFTTLQLSFLGHNNSQENKHTIRQYSYKKNNYPSRELLFFSDFPPALVQLMSVYHSQWWREFGLQNKGSRMDYQMNIPLLIETFKKNKRIVSK